MRSRRILSNISFNSLEFFEYVINDLSSNGFIDWCYWIKHYGDNDDKKDHIHFCFQPSSTIDTSTFNRHFYEFSFVDSDHRAKRPTVKYMPVTSLDDWLLYCKHDRDYLLTKGLERIYFYEWSDFRSTDILAFEHDVSNIDSTKYGRLSILRDGVKSKIPFAELIQQGSLPIAYRAQYEAQYRALQILDHNRKVAEWEKLDESQSKGLFD